MLCCTCYPQLHTGTRQSANRHESAETVGFAWILKGYEARGLCVHMRSHTAPMLMPNSKRQTSQKGHTFCFRTALSQWTGTHSRSLHPAWMSVPHHHCFTEKCTDNSVVTEIIGVYPNQKPRMNRVIHTLLKSRSDAFKMDHPILYK